MKNFVELNLNPAHLETGDCLIRAFSKAERISWENVLQKLIDIAKNTGNPLFNAHVNYEKMFNNFGYESFYVKGERITVNQLSNRCKSHVLAQTKSHMVYVEPKAYYDSWDSGKQYVLCYWKKREGTA